MAGEALARVRQSDFLICGGGTAGAALAGLLARDTDARIVLVEAGTDYGPLAAGQWPADVLDASTLCRSHQWGYTGLAHATHRQQTSYDRARILGGCSAHNGCVALLGHRRDYDAWAEAGNAGWSWEEVAPAFSRALAALRVRIPSGEEVTPWQRCFVEGAVAAGIPRSADLNDPDEVAGVAASPANIWQGMRWNTALAYLDPVRDRPNLTILSEALVDRVLLERGRATGVEVVVDGRRERLYAGLVVLASGAYGSPAILLRSGIGPEAHLRALGVPVVARLEGVGQGLTDHPDVSLWLDRAPALDAEMDTFRERAWLPDEQTLAKARSSRCNEAFDLHLYAVSRRSPTTGTWAYKIAVACVAPRSRGTLRLASTRPQDAPVIDHGFLSDPEGYDLDVLCDGMQLAREIMAAPPLVERFGAPPEPLAREELRELACQTLGIYYHPACSCRMGPVDDPMAVVGPDGRVHGVEGLAVCDASIFPSIMRANTNLPAAMLAEHLAPSLARA